MSSTFSMRALKVRFSGETHIGMKRQHNEDSLFLPDVERLVVVADGMGGHASGEVASKMAVDTLAEHFANTRDDGEISWPYRLDPGDGYEQTRLINGIQLANLRIYDRAQTDDKCHGMGTTIVAAIFCDDRVVIGHVGDSRVYRLRDGHLQQLTEDHSLLNDYIKMKKMTEEEIGKFQHKNVIVRALGMKESVQVDVMSDAFKLGDVYLMCSDGLSGMITDEGLAELLQHESDLDSACEALIATANKNGGVDNITCALARLEALH